MGFFQKLFGKRTEKKSVSKPSTPAADPSGDPNMIRVYDQYGRELFITRKKWRKDVLKPSLQQAWNKPDKLYDLIVFSLHDGFHSEIVNAARRLYQIDRDPIRSACIWGIVLMKEDRLDEAEAVFQDVTARHGEDGVIFTNWAKVHDMRKDAVRTEEYLWHALELDPNQDNGLLWYEALHREKEGASGGIQALRRVAALPNSWWARLWLARAALADNQVAEALALYRESLALAPSPAPVDLLRQLSGDLGSHGNLTEILELCAPRFVAEFHGIEVGNNLIKAYFELGQLDAAKDLLHQLYARKRPDWNENLYFWDTEIARMNAANRELSSQKMEVYVITLSEPVWLCKGSATEALFASKEAGSPVVAFLGSSVEIGEAKEKWGLSDMPGRTSRFLPLFLAEQLHLRTSGAGKVMIPCAAKGGMGFVLLGAPLSVGRSCDLARQGDPAADYLAVTHLNMTQEPCRVEMTVYRTVDQAVLDQAQTTFFPEQPETAFLYLFDRLEHCLGRETQLSGISNPHYQVPCGAECSNYLLRLEQALAVLVSGLENIDGNFLSGEHEIIDGCIQLNLDNPQNIATRLLLAQTLKSMKKARARIIPEFREKIALLQKKYPLAEPAHGIVETLFHDIFDSKEQVES